MPSRSTLPADRGEGGQQAHGREDHRGLAAARLAEHADALAGVDRQVDAAHGVRRAPVGGVEPHVQAGDLEHAARRLAGGRRGRLHVDGLHASSSAVARRRLKLFGETWALPRRGFMASSTPCPTRKLPSTTRAMQTPGGTIAHQAPADTAECRKAFSMIVPQLTRCRVAQADEGQRRLEEDGAGHGEHRLGDEQRRHVGQDVPADDVEVAGAQAPRAAHEAALLERVHLGAHHVGDAHPAEQADDEHDVVDRLPEQRREHDHQGQRRDDEEEVGDAGHRGLPPAALVAGEDAERAADQHGDERGGEADEHRVLGAGDDQAEHVDAGVVGAQPVGGRRRLERLAARARRPSTARATGASSATTVNSTTMTMPATIVGRRSRARASLIPRPSGRARSAARRRGS